MSDQPPLIEIKVRITSKCHRLLTRRALQLGRDRDEEGGRLLNRMLLQLLDSPLPPALPNERGRTYTREEVDAEINKAVQQRLSRRSVEERFRREGWLSPEDAAAHHGAVAETRRRALLERIGTLRGAQR